MDKPTPFKLIDLALENARANVDVLEGAVLRMDPADAGPAATCLAVVRVCTDAALSQARGVAAGEMAGQITAFGKATEACVALLQRVESCRDMDSLTLGFVCRLAEALGIDGAGPAPQMWASWKEFPDGVQVKAPTDVADVTDQVAAKYPRAGSKERVCGQRNGRGDVCTRAEHADGTHVDHDEHVVWDVQVKAASPSAPEDVVAQYPRATAKERPCWYRRPIEPEPLDAVCTRAEHADGPHVDHNLLFVWGG